MKRLCRSESDRKLCGVCGGIGAYLGIDPTVIRLIFVFLGLASVRVVFYILAAILIPPEDAF